ncbi:MAG: helix-turn-helix transcriptional regulator [Lachnospiraceae bacterium]|nr:helix-turn-helix transcriptional regulator [Lachnospiraceae bacterium]
MIYSYGDVKNNNIIGERLYKLRMDSGTRVTTIAEFICNNYSKTRDLDGLRTEYYKWENGNLEPSLEMLTILCNFYDCEIDYLLGNISERKKSYTDINEKTGLSIAAIESLIQTKEVHDLFFGHRQTKNDKLDIINLILTDKKNGFSSFLDILTGFCRFNISNAENKMYTVDSHGITDFREKKTIPGGSTHYNPKQAHFHLEDMESMYYLKIWDAIKEIKKEYCKSNKAPGT